MKVVGLIIWYVAATLSEACLVWGDVIIHITFYTLENQIFKYFVACTQEGN